VPGPTIERAIGADVEYFIATESRHADDVRDSIATRPRQVSRFTVHVITIHLEYAPALVVTEIEGPVATGETVTFLREIHWRRNAGVTAVAKAFALLHLRKIEKRSAVLSTAGPGPEGSIVSTCRGVLRSPRAQKHWSITVLSGEFGPRFTRTPLENAIQVTGATKCKLTPVGDALDRVRFLVDGDEATPEQLAEFAGVELAVKHPKPAVPGVVFQHDEPTAHMRAARDNVFGRPCLAICGSSRTLDVEMIDAVCDGLAVHLSRHPWHVLHGAGGVGIDTVNTAVTYYQAMDLTSTTMFGANVQIVAPADVVIFIGGTSRTRIETRVAGQRGKACIPVRATGGVAEECWHELPSWPTYGLTTEEYDELGVTTEPKAISSVISRILIRLAGVVRASRK